MQDNENWESSKTETQFAYKRHIAWEKKLMDELSSRGIDLSSMNPFLVAQLDLDWMYRQGLSVEDAAEQIHILLG